MAISQEREVGSTHLGPQARCFLANIHVWEIQENEQLIIKYATSLQVPKGSQFYSEMHSGSVQKIHEMLIMKCLHSPHQIINDTNNRRWMYWNTWPGAISAQPSAYHCSENPSWNCTVFGNNMHLKLTFSNVCFRETSQDNSILNKESSEILSECIRRHVCLIVIADVSRR
jgi:hypothetical protein